jgi:hypothetical protein
VGTATPKANSKEERADLETLVGHFLLKTSKAEWTSGASRSVHVDRYRPDEAHLLREGIARWTTATARQFLFERLSRKPSRARTCGAGFRRLSDLRRAWPG